MKVQIFSVFDRIVGQSIMILTAKNAEALKRPIRSALMAREPNAINTDCKEKDIYFIGELDDETQTIIPQLPKMAFTIDSVREDLINLIAAETGKSKDEISKHVGVEHNDPVDTGVEKKGEVKNV